jgi:hypothetical protein
MRCVLKIYLLIPLVIVAACQQSSTGGEQPFLPGGGNIRLVALGDCMGSSTALAADSQDKLLATVSGGTVSFVHTAAVFNCCLDSLNLEMFSWGGILRVLELPYCDQPCDCTCDYVVHGEITELEPGFYTLEICTDSLAHQALCSVSFRIGE